MTPSIWLIKAVLSHLMTDFILQPTSWTEDRKKNHFRSLKLYIHGIVTGMIFYLFLGWHYWAAATVIFITHTLIDGWKSYRKDNIFYFLLDQSFHFIIIALCWLITFYDNGIQALFAHVLSLDRKSWLIITAIVFLTTPCGILIGKLTGRWRDKIEDAESLANAGKWIGMTERLIVLALVLQNQYAAIGLLVTAKGIIRFGEKERPEFKTEYLVIGTLLSIGIALGTGLLTKI